MTTAELAAILAAFPPETEVFFEDDYQRRYPPERFHVRLIGPGIETRDYDAETGTVGWSTARSW